MFFPNMVLGIRVLHSRRKEDQDGYMIRMDQEVYISAWRVAWIRELGRISWSDPFPSMAILKLKVTPQTPKTFQMLLQTKLNTQAEFPGSKAGLQTLLGALGLTTQGDPSVSQMARVVSHALVSRCVDFGDPDWRTSMWCMTGPEFSDSTCFPL